MQIWKGSEASEFTSPPTFHRATPQMYAGHRPHDSREPLWLGWCRMRTAARPSLGCDAEVTAQEGEHVLGPHPSPFVREHVMSRRARPASLPRCIRLVDHHLVRYPPLLKDVGQA